MRFGHYDDRGVMHLTAFIEHDPFLGMEDHPELCDGCKTALAKWKLGNHRSMKSSILEYLHLALIRNC